MSFISQFVSLTLGKKRKETVCIALVSEENKEIEDKMILMNKVVRRNLRVRMGDIVSVHPCPNDVPNAAKIHVLPFADSIEGITGNITQTYLIRLGTQLQHSAPRSAQACELLITCMMIRFNSDSDESF